MFGSKRREVRSLVKDYNEGRRLMRVGDDADEWIGMSMAKRALYALVELSRNEEGKKCSRSELAECLRSHGLREKAKEFDDEG